MFVGTNEQLINALKTMPIRGGVAGQQVALAAADEIARLTAERDEARASAAAAYDRAASESAKVRAHRATIDSMARLLRDARRLLGDECEALRSSIAIIGQPGAMSQSPEDAPTREAIREITDWMDRAERVLNMETNSDA